MTKFLASAALLSLLCATAQSQPILRTVHELHVSYGDLNLGNRSGAQVLMQRLNHAATQVCGPRPALRDLDSAADFNSCRKDALDRAVARIASPQLADIYGAELARQHLASR